MLSFIGGAGILLYRHLDGTLRRLEDTLGTRGAQSNEEQMIPHIESLVESHVRQLKESLATMVQDVNELRTHEASGVTWLETLYHIFQLLGEAETEEQLYENITTAFAMINGYTQVMLLLGSDELGPLYLVAALGLPQPALQEWQGRPWRPPLWGVVAPALAKGKSFSAREDVGVERSFKEEFPWPIQGDRITAVPLPGMEGFQGVVLLVRSGAPRLSAQWQMRLLEMVAHIAGLTLESKQLVKGVQSHITELVTIQSITRTVVAVTSAEDLASTLGAEINAIFGPTYVALVLREEEQFQVYYADPKGLSRVHDKGAFIDWRVITWVQEAAQPLFFNPGEVQEDVGSLMFESEGRAMAVPLEGHEGILGVLVVTAQSPGQVFEEPQLVGIRTIANAAVVGLYAIRYYALVKQQA